MEISDFWRDCEEYTLHEAAYLVCGLEPKAFNPTDPPPAKVISAGREMKRDLVKAGAMPTDSLAHKFPVSSDIVRQYAEYFNETDFFKSAPSSKNHFNPNKSDRLALLNQASNRFWSNAVAGDKSTWPDNSEVSSWLQKNNFSKRLADAGATIIRPDWAESGRKPNDS